MGCGTMLGSGPPPRQEPGQAEGGPYDGLEAFLPKRPDHAAPRLTRLRQECLSYLVAEDQAAGDQVGEEPPRGRVVVGRRPRARRDARRV